MRIESPEAESLKEEGFKLDDRVKYTDKEGNVKEGSISLEEGKQHLVEGVIEVAFDDGSREGVPVSDLEKIEESESKVEEE